MPRPSILTYNELDGLEVREILENRVEQIFSEVPYFKKHLTLPRVRMTLNVKLEIWADQPHPDTVSIGDSLTVVLDQPSLADVFHAEAIDSAAPGPGGHPPDKLREMHGLPISKPDKGDKEIGAQIAFADQETLVDERRPALPGVEIHREGAVTSVIIDQGPAGLQHGTMNREPFRFGRPKQ
jgi:hypothetical protein